MVEALRRMFSRSPHIALIDEIKGFAALRPGWNSYVAPQISGTAIKAAVEIVGVASRLGAMLPSAAPTPCGGVALTWTTEGIEAQLLIDDESFEYSVARHGSPKVTDQGSLHGVPDVEKYFIARHLIHPR